MKKAFMLSLSGLAFLASNAAAFAQDGSNDPIPLPTVYQASTIVVRPEHDAEQCAAQVQALSPDIRIRGMVKHAGLFVVVHEMGDDFSYGDLDCVWYVKDAKFVTLP